ncbi:MAG: hypothetical protein ISN26_06315 [Betaproteobacteria bacterium AqS2]|uniref:Uncharacterized protein n=1 Tax=Candidatus Amphirhobacter heronislandensis TaxID=1732024 RepID=A0A930Y391_9GAMM|nr:hypothetical protein [Betaproteobacteria bacterium AqS2]
MSGPAGGVEDIQRYHRASRLLLSCLLLPLATGLLLLDDGILLSIMLYMFWMLFSQLNSRALSELAAYSPDLEPAAKAARWRSVLREKIRHELTGLAAAAVMLLCLQELINHPTTPGQDIPVKFTVAWFTLFWLTALIPLLDTMLVHKGSRKIAWALLALLLAAGAPFPAQFPFLLPHALALLLYLLGLIFQKPARRHSLILHASDVCGGTGFIMAAAIAVWLIGFLLGLGLEEENWLPLPGFDLPLLALIISFFSLQSFMKHERIRHGLFTTDFDEIGKKKLRRQKRESLLRAFDPQEASAGYWNWVRLVTRLGRFAWLVALLSILVVGAFVF